VGLFILIAILLVIGIVGFFLPKIAKVFIHLDYVFLFALVWGFVFGATGWFGQTIAEGMDAIWM